MSLRLQEEMEQRAANKLGNMWNATVALIRPRLLRWLSLLVTNADQKTRARVAQESFQMTSFLMRRQKLAKAVREQIRAVYTNFDPELHYARVVINGKGEERSRTPVPIQQVPAELQYARHMWHITIVHDRMVERWLESLELYADGLFELTGTAIIQKMLDYSRPGNFAVDPMAAEEISTELWGNGIEEVEQTTEEAK